MEFEDSKITIESDFDFGQWETNIDVLCFRNTKFWSPKGTKAAAKNLVEALSKSPLQYSVKEIRRSGWNISETSK